MDYPLIESYNDLVENQGDPRSNKLLFINSPRFSISMVSIYLIFSLYIGPKFMRNRKAYDLKRIIIFYNFLQACASAYIVYWGSTGYFAHFDNWFCVPQDYNDVTPETLDQINCNWWFFFSRFFEFADTIFFVLRKKDKQITTLHLVHHSIVPIIAWIGMKFVPISQYTFPGYINVFVHIIMYTYYMLSAMGPSVRKYLWWKKYLTALQLIQFLIVLSHIIIVMQMDCPGPKWFPYMLIMQAALFFLMFSKFYLKEYSKMQDINASNIISITYNKLYSIYENLMACKALFEACIPNQHALMDNSADDDEEDLLESEDPNKKQK